MRTAWVFPTLAWLGAYGLPADRVVAQCELAEFSATVPAPGDKFGQSLALDGDELVVGARYSATVFVRSDGGSPADPMDDEYVFQSQLASGVSGDLFGRAVALDEDHLAVGAPMALGLLGEGLAFVYRRNDNSSRGDPSDDSWTLESELTGVQSGGANFGRALQLDGDCLVVGEPNGKPFSGSFSHGLVHVFEHTDSGTPTNSTDDAWLLNSILLPSNADAGDDFGVALDLAGDRLVVGAPGAVPSGLVYFFRRDDAGTPDPGDDAWIEQAKIGPPGGPPSPLFGWAIDMDGDRLVVGSNGAVHTLELDDGGTPADPADDAWVHEAVVVSPNPLPLDGFGSAIAIHGERLLVGSPSHGTFLEGAAYYFHHDGQTSGPESWLPVVELKSSTFGGKDEFGASVLIGSGHAFAGELGFFSFLSDQGPAESSKGTVTAYAVAEAPWLFIDASSSSGSQAPCFLAAGPLTPDSTVTIVFDALPGQGTGAIVLGLASVYAPFKGGVLVPTPDLIVWLAGLTGTGFAMSAHWPSGIASGAEFFLQAWMSDSSSSSGVVSTNGIKAVVP